MSALHNQLTAHPLNKTPYHAIKYPRADGNGVPLYTVAKDKRQFGAAAAVKVAFEQLGGHCFFIARCGCHPNHSRKIVLATTPVRKKTEG